MVRRYMRSTPGDSVVHTPTYVLGFIVEGKFVG